jgi:hypothetical protein
MRIEMRIEMLNILQPICPLDLQVGETYIDMADKFVFTVKSTTLKGSFIKIETENETFTLGGLYRKVFVYGV